MNASSNHVPIVYSPTSDKLALMNGQTLQKAFCPLPGRSTAVYTSSGLAYYRACGLAGQFALCVYASRTKYFDVAYAPYGEDYVDSGTTDLNFTGQNQDTVPGMYDFLYREYHANSGRWIQPDPAGLGAANPSNPQTWNRYAYVGNNPLNSADLLGLFRGDALGSGGICIEGPYACAAFATNYVNGIEVSAAAAASLLSMGAAVNIGSNPISGFNTANNLQAYAYTVIATDFGVGYDYFGVGFGTAAFELDLRPNLAAANNKSSQQPYLSVTSDKCSGTTGGRNIQYKLNGATGYVWEVLTYSNGNVANNTAGATLNGYPDFISIWGTQSPITQRFVMSPSRPQPGTQGSPLQIQQNIGVWPVMLKSQLIRRTNNDIYVAGNPCPK